MKKMILIQAISVLMFLCSMSVHAMPLRTSFDFTKPVYSLPEIPADTTVTVTIVNIDLAANKVTLKDQNDKLYVFTVDPAKIDLRKFKVGQTLTATISTTMVTNNVTRARISKQQLIKLQ